MPPTATAFSSDAEQEAACLQPATAAQAATNSGRGATAGSALGRRLVDEQGSPAGSGDAKRARVAEGGEGFQAPSRAGGPDSLNGGGGSPSGPTETVRGRVVPDDTESEEDELVIDEEWGSDEGEGRALMRNDLENAPSIGTEAVATGGGVAAMGGRPRAGAGKPINDRENIALMEQELATLHNQDSDVAKNRRRALKNCISAARSREKKRKYVHDLEQAFAQRSAECQQVAARLAESEKENQQLRAALNTPGEGLAPRADAAATQVQPATLGVHSGPRAGVGGAPSGAGPASAQGGEGGAVRSFSLALSAPGALEEEHMAQLQAQHQQFEGEVRMISAANNAEVERLGSANKALSEKHSTEVARLTAESEESKARTERLRAANQDVGEMLGVAKRALRTANEGLTQLKGEVQFLGAENNAVAQRLRDANKALEEQRERVDAWRAQCEDVERAKLEDHAVKLQHLTQGHAEEKVQLEQGHLATLQQRLRLLEDSLREELEAEIHNLEQGHAAQLEEGQTAYEAQQQALSQVRAELQSRIAANKSAFEAEQKAQALRRSVQQSERAKCTAALQGVRAELLATRTQLEAEKDAGVSTVAAAREEIIEERAQCKAELQGQDAALAELRAMAAAGVGRLEACNAEVQRQVAANNAAMEEAHKAHKAQRAEVASLQQQLTEKEAERAELEGAMDTLRVRLLAERTVHDSLVDDIVGRAMRAKEEKAALPVL